MQVVCSSALFLNIMQAVFSIVLLYSSVSVKQAVFSIALLYSFVTVSVLYKQCSALPCCVCQCYAGSVQHCLAVFVSISVMQAVYSIALLCWSTGLYLHLSYNGASGVQHCLAVCWFVPSSVVLCCKWCAELPCYVCLQNCLAVSVSVMQVVYSTALLCSPVMQGYTSSVHHCLTLLSRCTSYTHDVQPCIALLMCSAGFVQHFSS